MFGNLLSRERRAPEIRLVHATNLTRGTVLADRAVIADSSSTRRTGLLKRSSLAEGEGMWIAPCECIHTFGMKFAIDIVFISKKRKVVRAVENVGKRRIKMALRAHSVLELPAGTIARTGTQAGDDLRLQAAGNELAEERPQADRSRHGGEDCGRKLATADRPRSCFGSFEAVAIAVVALWIAALAFAYRFLELSPDRGYYGKLAVAAVLAFAIGICVDRNGARKLGQTCMVAGCSIAMSGALSATVHACARSQAPFIDSQLARIDGLVGFSTAAVVAAARHAPLERSILDAAYVSVSLVLIICLIAPVWRGDIAESRRLLIALCMLGVVTALIAAVWPAEGPWIHYGYAASDRQATVHAYLLELRSGQPMTVDTDRGALVTFPSFHTTMAIACAIAARRIRVLRWIVCALAGGICVSTLSTGWHYGVDVLCGAFLAVAGYLAARPVVRWMEGVSFAGAVLQGGAAPAPETAPVP